MRVVILIYYRKERFFGRGVGQGISLDGRKELKRMALTFVDSCFWF